ncbi:MAG: type IV pilus secretin PilQ family protein, partial [Pseudomonadota bacterium]|nr:type IV pilus secretin PilQ family protein [Pseudomonadota bacterium]
PVQPQVTHVDFRRGVQGQGIINVTLSDPGVTADVREEGGRIVAVFPGAVLPASQERRLDVVDFATPVSLVDVLNQNGTARIAVQASGNYDYLAYQSDDRFTIEVKPAIEEEDEEEDPTGLGVQRAFTGEVLSLNFQDVEVRAVLQIIADFTGLNVVVSDTVRGNLTLRLRNVPWDQALDIILRTKGLTMRQNGNVIYVAPTEEVAAREKLELESRRQKTELVPLRSEVIQVNYAKAGDLGELLKSEEVSLLSARGQVTVDERTNTLLVQDVAEKITEIRNLVARLDVPVRQVIIDSRIVVASDDFSRELGVRFGASAVTDTDDGVVTTSGSLEGTNTVVGSAVNNLATTGQPFPVTVPSLTDRLGVNLGTTQTPFGRLALAILGQDYLLDLELSALQAEGRGEVLSNPRVITTDRAEAVIKQGMEIPYQVRTEDTIAVAFREANLELRVTPQITPDNRIIMDLSVTRNERGENVPSGVDGGFIPAINTREVQTQVLVNNGETVVLGGVFEHVTDSQLDKVPVLGDLPLLGRLFKRTNTLNEKDELLIFVTPQIIGEGIAVR